MSFFDDASLVFLPSGQAGKDGKAYSMKPTNGNGDFTFSRGSNLTATRIDSNGLIEKGRENLLLQSNQFDTTWNNDLGTGGSIQDGQTGYDGSSDAWLITKNKSVGRINQGSISFDGVSTFSVYVKAGDSDYIVIQAVSNYAYFDLTTGLAQNETSGVISATSTDVGNGWYRCSIVFNISASSSVYIYPAENGSVSGTSGSIYIQDAQVEIGLTSTEYIESGASTGLAGILEDSPRFDYSGGASCPSLLLEPQRTNSLKYSEYYATGSGAINSWSYVNSPILTFNTSEVTSPQGLYNATKITGNGSSGLYHSAYVTGTCARSVYLRSVSGSTSVVLKDPVQTITSKTLNLTTEWQRYELVEDNTNGASSGIWIDDISSSGIYMWGAQLEEGSYPTSYIPNHSGGSVTREADSCEGAGTSSTFNDAEGVLYAEIAALADDGTNKYISINNGGTDDYLFLRYRSDNRFQVRYRSNNTDSLNETFDLSNNLDFNKIAVSYKRNEFKIFVNGSQIGSTDTSGTIFNVSVDNLDFESFNGGSNFYGKVKQVIVFNTALSDVEMITLTS